MATDAQSPAKLAPKLEVNPETKPQSYPPAPPTSVALAARQARPGTGLGVPSGSASKVIKRGGGSLGEAKPPETAGKRGSGGGEGDGDGDGDKAAKGKGVKKPGVEAVQQDGKEKSARKRKRRRKGGNSEAGPET